MSLAIVFCFVMAIVAKAQEIPHEEGPDNVTQEEQNYCVVRNYTEVKNVLDSIYNAAINRISYHRHRGKIDTSIVEKKALIQSQKSWLKYCNDASELIHALYENGSAGNAVAYIYRTKLMLERIRKLNFLIHSNIFVVKPDWNWGMIEK